MTRLIQDIVPSVSRKYKPLSSQSAKRITQVHKATNIPHLIDASQRRASSFDVVVQRRRKIQSHSQIKTVKLITSDSNHNLTKRKLLLRRLGDYAQYPLIATVAIAAAYSSVAGQIVVFIFAIVFFFAHWQSRYIFMAALLMLASIPLFEAVHESSVSSNSAIYAYELLAIGLFMSVMELLHDNKQSIQRNHLSKRISKLFNKY